VHTAPENIANRIIPQVSVPHMHMIMHFSHAAYEMQIKDSGQQYFRLAPGFTGGSGSTMGSSEGVL